MYLGNVNNRLLLEHGSPAGVSWQYLMTWIIPLYCKEKTHHNMTISRVVIMVHNATSNNISVISRRSVLLVDEIGVVFIFVEVVLVNRPCIYI